MTTASRHAHSRRRFAPLALLAVLIVAASPAVAQESGQRAAQEPMLKQIAPDLHFFFDYNGSNAVFLVTDQSCVCQIWAAAISEDIAQFLKRVLEVRWSGISWKAEME